MILLHDRHCTLTHSHTYMYTHRRRRRQQFVTATIRDTLQQKRCMLMVSVFVCVYKYTYIRRRIETKNVWWMPWTGKKHYALNTQKKETESTVTEYTKRLHTIFDEFQSVLYVFFILWRYCCRCCCYFFHFCRLLIRSTTASNRNWTNFLHVIYLIALVSKRFSSLMYKWNWNGRCCWALNYMHTNLIWFLLKHKMCSFFFIHFCRLIYTCSHQSHSLCCTLCRVRILFISFQQRAKKRRWEKKFAQQHTCTVRLLLLSRLFIWQIYKNFTHFIQSKVSGHILTIW